MISTDLRSLAGYFLDRHDTGIIMESVACKRVGNALLEIATRIQKIELKPVPKRLRAAVTSVPLGAYAHLICKEPPWGWGEQVLPATIKEAPEP